MIKSLIYYDVKKIRGTLPYFYVFALFFACLTRFISIWKDIQFFFILGQIFQGVTFAMIVNILVNVFLSAIVRSFVPSFFGDESYLTHTLPVEKSKLLLSKVISTIILVLLSVLVCLISLFIMFYSKDAMLFIKTTINVAIVDMNLSAEGFIILIAVVLFLQILTTLLMGYSAIFKGYYYDDNKVLKSFIWFAIFYFATTIVNLLIAVIVLAIGGSVQELFASVISGKSLTTLLITVTINYVFFAVAFYIISQKLFERGVNVD